jgi:nucleoside-triphosphatase
VITAGPVRVIVTGEVGRGKTQACRAAAARLRGLGWEVAGVLSPGVWAAGRKVAIDALDLRSGEARRLAKRAGVGCEAAGPATRGWRFYAETLAWCNSLLTDAIDCDLLVVDELGPLEFESGEGLAQGMRAVDGGRFRLGLVVVRPRLLQAARLRWPGAEVLVVDGQAQIPARVEQVLELAGTVKPSRPRDCDAGLGPSGGP